MREAKEVLHQEPQQLHLDHSSLNQSKYVILRLSNKYFILDNPTSILAFKQDQIGWFVCILAILFLSLSYTHTHTRTRTPAHAHPSTFYLKQSIHVIL